MNPDTYINNELGNLWNDTRVQEGDKITIYDFDENGLVSLIDFARLISIDYRLNVNEVLLRYFPDIESHNKETYTFIRTEKCRGDRWVILLKEDGKETHLNLSEIENCFYSIEKSN